MGIKEIVSELKDLESGLCFLTEEHLEVISAAIGVLKRVDERKIVEIIQKEAFKQVCAIHGAVEDYGLMNTGWKEIDSKGGSITFEGLAQAIVSYLEAK